MSAPRITSAYRGGSTRCEAPTIHTSRLRPDCPRGRHEHACQAEARYEGILTVRSRTVRLCGMHWRWRMERGHLAGYRELDKEESSE